MPSSFVHTDIELDLMEGSGLTRAQLIFINVYSQVLDLSHNETFKGLFKADFTEKDDEELVQVMGKSSNIETFSPEDLWKMIDGLKSEPLAQKLIANVSTENSVKLVRHFDSVPSQAFVLNLIEQSQGKEQFDKTMDLLKEQDPELHYTLEIQLEYGMVPRKHLTGD